MKKVIILVYLIAISFYCTVQGQTKINSNDTIKLICSGKWYVETLEIQGQKMIIPESEQKNNWVIFNENGTLEESDMGEKASGKWTYLPQKHTIKTDDKDGISDQIIIKISDKAFTYSVIDKKSGEKMIIYEKINAT